MKFMNTMYMLLLIILVSIIPIGKIIKAQVVFTPHEHSVYQFLERLDSREIIDFNSEVKPLSRIAIAELLRETALNRAKLNKLELEELDFYYREFALELGKSIRGSYFESNAIWREAKLKDERYWLYRYTDDNFKLRVKPVFGYGIKNVAGGESYIRWPGFHLWGYGSDWFGASFEYVDFGEGGDHTDSKKSFSPETGAFINNRTGNTFEYSDLKGSATVSWDWGYISIIKDYQTWGNAQFGQIILSDKAPSFAQVRFYAKPVDWFRFYYFQGWLNSLILDSSAVFISHPESLDPEIIIPYKDKYIVANLVSFSLTDYLDFSVGNAFVYGPNFRIETMIPFMYYKALDHNTGRIQGDNGNGMVFSDFKFQPFDNFKLYGSGFIDVINFRDLLKGELDTQWLAFSVGLKKYNLFANFLDISMEYTRINPWIYENINDLASYKHLGYQLGHWIGQNADIFRLQINYSFLRGLRHFLFFESTRKAAPQDIAFAYSLINTNEVSFLDRLLRRDKRIGLQTEYEPYHELKFKGYLEYSEITDNTRELAPEYLLGKKFSFALMLSYGI